MLYYQLIYWLWSPSPNFKLAVSFVILLLPLWLLPFLSAGNLKWNGNFLPGQERWAGPRGTGISFANTGWTPLITCHLISLSKLRLLGGTILLSLEILLGVQSQVAWHMEMDVISSDETANTQLEQQHCVWAREQPMSRAWETSPRVWRFQRPEEITDVIMAKTTICSLLVDQNISIYVQLKHTSSPCSEQHLFCLFFGDDNCWVTQWGV